MVMKSEPVSDGVRDSHDSITIGLGDADVAVELYGFTFCKVVLVAFPETDFRLVGQKRCMLPVHSWWYEACSSARLARSTRARCSTCTRKS